MEIEPIFNAILIATLLIVLGKWIRMKTPVFQRIFLPSSIIAGILALLVGPEVLGRLAGDQTFLKNGLWPAEVVEVWSTLPGLVISVVFAALFLGREIPRPKIIWRKAGPIVAHGQALAWGQYMVGLATVVFLLIPLKDAEPMAGALIEIGFEGGHGTAAGLRETFQSLGYENGADLALGMATLGVVLGVLIGTAAINWSVWRGYIDAPNQSDQKRDELAEPENREKVPAPVQYNDQAIEPLSIHFGFIALAIGLGWLMLEGFIYLEETVLLNLGWPELFSHLPLFPLAMIGGVIVQILGDRYGYTRLIDRRLMNRISGASLDLLVVAALGSLSIQAIGNELTIFLVLALVGTIWTSFCFFILARLMFQKDWVPLGLANFGQGMGMTVIGLLLIRMVDPDDKTNAMEAFGYKQLLFAPIVGGGVFTAASLPLIANFGAVPVLIGVTILTLGWIALGICLFGPYAQTSSREKE